MSSNHIFIFSVGPVQTFIAQARKAQDLFGGSRLLSALADKAIQTAKAQGIDITYPQQTDNNNGQNIPNQFAGIYNGNEDLATIGQTIESAVRNLFTTLAHDALKFMQAPPDFDQNAYFDQINSHLEITWFFKPYTPETYAHNYQTAEKIFGGLKNIRTFTQLPEKGRKCNLDGERNVKVYRKTKDEKDIPKLFATKLFTQPNQVCLWDNQPKDKDPRTHKLLQTGEGLSAVSFLKRWYKHKNLIFPSTANIALYDMFNWCNGNENFVKHLQPIGLCLTEAAEVNNNLLRFADEINGQVFYEENLTPKFFEQQGLPEGALSCVRQHVQKLPASMLKKYYAVLTFDGDSMGKIMTGHFLKPDKCNQYLHNFQKETSRLLTQFAKSVEKIITFPKGRVIYAGGDDCLALINLNHLYDVLLQVQGEFHRTVNSPLQQTFTDVLKPGCNFTFSAGIAIAHYGSPMGIALNEARRLQDKAKEESDRNAFAIGVLKKSGETHQTCFKWQQLPHLQTITQQLQQDNFSDTFIRSLNRELALFIEVKGFINQIENANFIRLEMQRLLERSKKSDLKNADFDAMLDALNKLLTNTQTLEFFLEALNIANYIKRQTNQPEKTAAHAY